MPAVPDDDDNDLHNLYDLIDPYGNDIPKANLDKMNLDLDNMQDDDTEPITKKELKAEIDKLLETQTKVKNHLFKKHPRLMKIEQESIVGLRCLCPPGWRPFEAYAISSNHTFELARLERRYRCSICWFNRPELQVYSTQYKY